MIKLSGSRFTDIMPENLASQAEVQAIAYALAFRAKAALLAASPAFAEGSKGTWAEAADYKELLCAVSVAQMHDKLIF